MQRFSVLIEWQNLEEDFAYSSYKREHHLNFSGGQKITNSAAVSYGGDPKASNPDELLLAAVSSCHMLTFLAIAAKSRMYILSYEDQSEAILQKNEEGITQITKIILKPKIIFKDTEPSANRLLILHQKAHKHCIIANSIKAKVEVL